MLCFTLLTFKPQALLTDAHMTNGISLQIQPIKPIVENVEYPLKTQVTHIIMRSHIASNLYSAGTPTVIHYSPVNLNFHINTGIPLKGTTVPLLQALFKLLGHLLAYFRVSNLLSSTQVITWLMAGSAFWA